MKVITIPNLSNYQHYGKDRETNPWIKWHKKCLRDYKFRQLTNSERWIFIGLILLARENNNEIPADLRDIGLIISHSLTGFNRAVLKLMDLKLIAIKRVARRYQNGALDKIRIDKNRLEKNTVFLNSSYKKIGELK